MKQHPGIKWIVVCTVLVLVVFVAMPVFKVFPSNLIFWGILLLCPLMHFWMMKSDKHKH